MKLNPLLIAVFAVLAVYSISIILLLAWGFLTSLKSVTDFTDMGNVLGLPNTKFSAKQVRFYNYAVVLQSFSYRTGNYSYISGLFGMIEHTPIVVTFPLALLNTVIYAVGGSLVGTFTTMTVAYICAKYKYKFSNAIYVTVVVAMTIPIVGAQTSMIVLLRNLGMYNSYIGMWFQKISFTGMYFLVFYAFFQGVSDTYIEAAEIDGASQFAIYLRILIPLAIKIFGTVFLLDFIALWNDYQTPLLYFPSRPTLSYLVYQMSIKTSGTAQGGNDTQGAPQRVAGCMILALPLLVLFIAFKDKILGTMSIGGIKE